MANATSRFFDASGNMISALGGSAGEDEAPSDGTDGGGRAGRSTSGGEDFGAAFQQSMTAQNRELKKYDAIVHRVFYGDGDPDFDGVHKH